jgi:hypothetical protein
MTAILFDVVDKGETAALYVEKCRLRLLIALTRFYSLYLYHADLPVGFCLNFFMIGCFLRCVRLRLICQEWGI